MKKLGLCCALLLLVAGGARAAEVEFKPGIPGLKMADVRDRAHLWREIEELQSWERGDRVSVAEFRRQVVDKTSEFLGFSGTAADEWKAEAMQTVIGLRDSFHAGRQSDVDPSDPQSPFTRDLADAVARMTSRLLTQPRHELFAPDFKKWLLRLAFGPSEAKEARELQANQ